MLYLTTSMMPAVPTSHFLLCLYACPTPARSERLATTFCRSVCRSFFYQINNLRARRGRLMPVFAKTVGACLRGAVPGVVGRKGVLQNGLQMGYCHRFATNRSGARVKQFGDEILNSLAPELAHFTAAEIPEVEAEFPSCRVWMSNYFRYTLLTGKGYTEEARPHHVTFLLRAQSLFRNYSRAKHSTEEFLRPLTQTIRQLTSTSLL
ncbi:hypothetical protein ACSFA0_23440 [Variovorax sp. LT1P1]|uniref:hypothetical protein n=1 Tax=Variovorax sp. LT1P1 TaxID=3443730 RepID=UPI003F46DBFF